MSPDLLFLIPLALIAGLAAVLLWAPRGRINRLAGSPRRRASDSGASTGDSGSDSSGDSSSCDGGGD